jgi:shikimate kinase
MAVITISRQYGAGGKTLGKMIAEDLDYEFADLLPEWFPNRWSTGS